MKTAVQQRKRSAIAAFGRFLTDLNLVPSSPPTLLSTHGTFSTTSCTWVLRLFFLGQKIKEHCRDKPSVTERAHPPETTGLHPSVTEGLMHLRPLAFMPSRKIICDGGPSVTEGLILQRQLGPLPFSH